MSRPIYSIRFGVWKHETGLVGVINDTPNTWVIREVTAYNGNLAEVNYFLFYDALSEAVLFELNPGLTPGPWSYWWEGRLVIPPGEGQGFAWISGGFPIDVSVQGYTLTPP